MTQVVKMALKNEENNWANVAGRTKKQLKTWCVPARDRLAKEAVRLRAAQQEAWNKKNTDLKCMKTSDSTVEPVHLVQRCGYYADFFILCYSDMSKFILSLTLACATGGDCTWQERPRGCLTLRVTKTLYFFFLLLPDDLGSPTTARACGRGGVLKFKSSGSGSSDVVVT